MKSSLKPAPESRQDAAIDVVLIDFSRIKLVGDDSAPGIVTISEADGFVLNPRFSDDFRIRKSIYERMRKAQESLPPGYRFMIYEAYRPLARQKKLWDMATQMLREKYPDMPDAELRDLTETFVADPFNGIGSGHQACCAIDVSLCDAEGNECDMGTACQEMNERSHTACQTISPEAIRNRALLVSALEGAGLINYPAEWWHFSYGDHQWAHLVGKTEAFYGPLDI
jgi:D-alanyl-D-alanine dipeptidase